MKIQPISYFAMLAYGVLMGVLCCVPVRAQDSVPDGMTPLMHAAWRGNVEKTKQLLQAGVAVDAADKQGVTALMWTGAWTTYDVIFGGYEEKHVEVARLLLDAGANINAIDNRGNTALLYAVEWGNFLVAKGLLDRGADVNLRDKQGRSALTFAACLGVSDKVIVGPMLDKGVRKNGIEAMLLGDLRLARALLTHGQGTRALGPQGETALMLAALYGDGELARAMLMQGADINVQDERGFTALMMAGGSIPSFGQAGNKRWQEYGHSTNQERETLMALLISHGARVNLRDKHGDTALMWNVERGQEEMVRLLLKSKADTTTKDAIGRSVLELAEEHKHAGIIKLLREAGAAK